MNLNLEQPDPVIDFNESNFNLLVRLPKIKMIDQYKLGELGLSQKKEQHITIIGTDTGNLIKQKYETLNENEKSKFLADLKKIILQFRFNYNLTDQYYLLSKIYPDKNNEERKALIQKIEVTDLDLFYTKLSQLLNFDVKIPYPHISLATTSSKAESVSRGIGIYSYDDFLSLNPVSIDL